MQEGEGKLEKEGLLIHVSATEGDEKPLHAL